MDKLSQHKIGLTVLFFSVLKEKLGMATMEVTIKKGANGADLLNLLCDSHEVIRAYRSVIRLAVNAGYAKEDVVLNHGDEVAFITPVSGG